jgi:integrase/recombinase XerD
MKNQFNTANHTWFNSLVSEYLDAQRSEHRPATLRAWQSALGHLQQFLQGQERLQDITSADLEAWRVALTEKHFAPATLEIWCRSARQFFTWLEQQQRLFLNPARDFIVPKPERPALPVLTREQLQSLLSQPDVNTTCGLRDRALLETTYATGMLVQELRGLHCQDVGQDTVHIRGKVRKVPLTPEANQWVQRYLQESRPKLLKHPSPALWLTTTGSPLGLATMQQIFRRHSLAAKLGHVSPNAVRRACVVHRWQAGAHPLELQLLLGHRKLQILSQYLRVTVRELFARHQEAQP